MIHAWILIFWISGGSQTFPPAVSTLEFNNREECVAAELALRREWGERAGGMCIEKGKKGKKK